MTTRIEIGRDGEDRAASWYQDRGFRVVARNWRVREGEIDLIATRGDDLVVFCEVKRRTTDRYGRGAEAVGWRKQQRIRAVALHWLSRQDGRFPEIRFDVAEVDAAGEVAVIEAAF